MSGDFIEKDLIYVNSKFRSSGTSDDFYIDLSSQLRTPNNYDSISLLNFSCPKSYYLINENNNKFSVNEGGTITEIVLDIGNYSFSSLTKFIDAQFNAYLQWNYTITANQSIGKYLFEVEGNHHPSFIFGENSPNEIIGFDQGTYTFDVNHQLESPNIVNFQKAPTIELCSDIVQKNIFAIIFPNVADFGSINYQEFNAQFNSQRLVKNNVNNAHFYLLDGATKKRLNINGLNFNFTFAIYKKNDYYKHMLDDMKLQRELIYLEDELRKKESQADQAGGHP